MAFLGRRTRVSTYTKDWMPTGDETPQNASGGDEVVTVGSTRYHVFTSSGTFTRNGVTSVQIMSVGGGASGGTDRAGGGGAGELDLFSSSQTIAANLTITIGSGGSAVSSSGVDGNQGGTTTVAEGAVTLATSLGGGKGAGGNRAGATGGSGGGAAGSASASGGGASGSNTNVGGNGASNQGAAGGGGGGGAGGAGANGSTSAGGAGGSGYALSSIDTNLTSANFPVSLASMTGLCGGGGGSVTTNAYSAGAGGTYGGGAGINQGTATSGSSWGSGGGGSGGYVNDVSGAGKGGIVIIKYTVL